MPKPKSEEELIAFFNSGNNVAWCICEEHGIQKAYYICNHVQHLGDIKKLIPWEDFKGGELCCGLPEGEHYIDDIYMLCEEHLKEKGLLLIM